MEKHKLEGYCIKGGEDIADRIRKVFEGDGVDIRLWAFLFESHVYFIEKNKVEGKRIKPDELKEITIDQAERIVFGEPDELKVGMKVVFTDKAKKNNWADDKIHEIESFNHLGNLQLLKLKSRTDEINSCFLRRATITDFLRTLPDDIAERALRQVDEGNVYYNEYPTSYRQAIGSFNGWDYTEEGDSFWMAVEDKEYDRARKILSEQQPEKTFPRMMEVSDDGWVIAAIGKTKYLVHVCENNDPDRALRGDKWFVYGGDSLIDIRTGTFNSLIRIATPKEINEHFERIQPEPTAPKKPYEIVSAILRDMDQIGGVPSNREFYDEFNNRLLRALAIDEPSPEITDEVMIKAVERLCEMVKEYSDNPTDSLRFWADGDITIHDSGYLTNFTSIPELIKHLRDEK